MRGLRGQDSGADRIAPGVIPVTVCIITKNEEANLPRLLAGTRWADETVVVDSFSTDRTAEIAREHGARVIQRAWNGFGDQQLYCFSLARNDWIFHLDADEELTPELQREVAAALASEPPDDVGGFSMPRLSIVFGRPIRHMGWYPDRKLRIFRRQRFFWTGYEPHAKFRSFGREVELRSDLLHYPVRDVAHLVSKLNAQTDAWAQGKLERGDAPPAATVPIRAAWKFVKTYVVRGGFLDGAPGLMLSGIAAFTDFTKVAKLWDLRRRGVEPNALQRGRSWAGPRPAETGFAEYLRFVDLWEGNRKQFESGSGPFREATGGR